VDAGGRKVPLFVGLHEIAAVVAEHLRLDDHHAGDLGLRKSELTHRFYLSVFVLDWDMLRIQIPFWRRPGPSGPALPARAAGPGLRPYQRAPDPASTTAAADTPRIRWR